MKLLVTGGAGFIGANFIHYWIEKYPKDKIRVIDLLTYAGNESSLKSVRSKIEFVKGDIVDRKTVKKVMDGIDTVVHFAAESHVDKSVLNPESFMRTNVKGTKVLLQEAEKAGVKRFHHISTDEVYGELALGSDEKFSEETPYAPRPDNLYAISKAEADDVVLKHMKKTSMGITISNCSNNYGPFQHPEKLIPVAITNLIDGIKVPVHGDGLNERDWIHTEDHASAVDLILKKGNHGEIYLVGSDNVSSNVGIVNKIIKLFGFGKEKIKHVPNRHSNDKRYAINATKIKKELGWEPKYTKKNFKKGLEKTIKWYKKNEDWWRPLIDEKAPLYNSSNNIIAYMNLDRVLGRTRIEYRLGNGGGRKKGKKKELVQDKRRTASVLKKLRSKKWYVNSETKVKDKLKKLAKNPRTIGFVEDIANRPEVIGGVQQLTVSKVSHSLEGRKIYGVAAWFMVKEKGGNINEVGYYSWGMGPKSGAKILVLLKKKKKITHIAVYKNEKFPVAEEVYDMVGGFPLPNESIHDLVSRNLLNKIGIDVTNPSVELEELIGLGRIMPDSGMTNNHPLLYSVILKVDDTVFPSMKKGKKSVEDVVVLWPVEKLEELVNKADDAYFLSSLSRLMLGGINKVKLGK